MNSPPQCQHSDPCDCPEELPASRQPTPQGQGEELGRSLLLIPLNASNSLSENVLRCNVAGPPATATLLSGDSTGTLDIGWLWEPPLLDQIQDFVAHNRTRERFTCQNPHQQRTYGVELARLKGDAGDFLVLTLESSGSLPGPSPRDVEPTSDPLTGLADRRGLQTWFAQRRVANPESAKPTAVLFVDCDDFKPINDTLGHRAGDEALQALARRWQQTVRDIDLVGRFGGDEFIVLVADVIRPLAVQRVARRIADAAATPLRIAGHTLQISVSIGVAVGDARIDQLEDLIAAADADMYRNRNRRRGSRQLYPRSPT